MSDVPSINIIALLLERDDMDAGVVQQLRTALAESPTQYSTLLSVSETLQESLQRGKGDAAKNSLKLGVASYFLGRMDRAAQLLATATTALGKFYGGLALNELGRHDDSIKCLDGAEKSGYAKSEVAVHRAAALRGLGRFDQAQKILDGLEEYVRRTGEYLYQQGLLLASQGDDGAAVSYLEQAIQADPRHQRALFHLAYQYDRNGDDEGAIVLYERCLQVPPPHVGTLINLGILYEDRERYDRACLCYQQVLRYYPNHPRARLFLRDAGSSRSQSFDEDMEQRNDRLSALLELPVTDFELSVRSRNCLRKMNIHRLGDLTRCTEEQLLASKNFGETSLAEIKNMLALKGLRLGQSLEQQGKRPRLAFNLEDYTPQEQALFKMPVSELNFSVRARKCMTRLGITTVGELVSHSGDDLLECKNFGVTSLFEVREKLQVYGLKLRGD